MDSACKLQVKAVRSAALFLLIFGICAAPRPSADTWWHLATGRWIFHHHAVPRTDPFSYTFFGRRWIAHEYLAEAGMYGLQQLGGFPALLLVNTALLTLAFWFIWQRCRRRRGLCAAALLLGAWGARSGFAIRPQTLTFLLAAVYLWILDRFLQAGRARILLLLPALMLLWVQLHGGYVLGISLIVLTLLAEALDWVVGRNSHFQEGPARSPLHCFGLLLASAAACVALVPLNPTGFALFRFPLELLRMKANRMILEWQPPLFSDPRYWPFVTLAALALLALMFSAQKYRPGQFLFFGVFLYAAFASRRNIPIFVLIAVPLVAEHARIPFSLEMQRRDAVTPGFRLAIVQCGTLMAAAAVCIYLTALAWRSQANASRYFPADAVRYLQEHRLPDNLVNAYGFGGYLIWACPERKVFIDGRADLYGDAFIAKFASVYDGQEVPDPLFARYQVRTAIVEPASGLAGVLSIKTGNGSWKKEYQDNIAVIYVKGQ